MYVFIELLLEKTLKTQVKRWWELFKKHWEQVETIWKIFDGQKGNIQNDHPRKILIGRMDPFRKNLKRRMDAFRKNLKRCMDPFRKFRKFRR